MDSGCLVRSGNRIDVHAAAITVKAHMPVHQGEDSVILAESDSLTWMELRSTLADDDVSRDHRLATKLFHAESLAYAVATVLYRSLTFLMSHKTI